MKEQILARNIAIVEHFGLDSQLHKLEEELVELLLAVKRVLSGKINIVSYSFLEEIADVENMMMQIKHEIQHEFGSSGDESFCIENSIDEIKMEKIERVYQEHFL